MILQVFGVAEKDRRDLHRNTLENAMFSSIYGYSPRIG
jgi:hypothetical protein